jgi:hypothetical protein
VDEAALLFIEAGRMERDARLSQTSRPATPKSVTPTSTARRHMSAAKSATNPLVAVANEAGHTLVSLAEAVTAHLGLAKLLPHSVLSRGARGERAVREDVAKAVQELTRSESRPHGYEASARNWPRGITKIPDKSDPPAATRKPQKR